MEPGGFLDSSTEDMRDRMEDGCLVVLMPVTAIMTTAWVQARLVECDW